MKMIGARVEFGPPVKQLLRRPIELNHGRNIIDIVQPPLEVNYGGDIATATHRTLKAPVVVSTRTRLRRTGTVEVKVPKLDQKLRSVNFTVYIY